MSPSTWGVKPCYSFSPDRIRDRDDPFSHWNVKKVKEKKGVSEDLNFSQHTGCFFKGFV